jgi:hypothetical protein
MSKKVSFSDNITIYKIKQIKKRMLKYNSHYTIRIDDDMIQHAQFAAFRAEQSSHKLFTDNEPQLSEEATQDAFKIRSAIILYCKGDVDADFIMFITDKYKK